METAFDTAAQQFGQALQGFRVDLALDRFPEAQENIESALTVNPFPELTPFLSQWRVYCIAMQTYETALKSRKSWQFYKPTPSRPRQPAELGGVKSGAFTKEIA